MLIGRIGEVIPIMALAGFAAVVAIALQPSLGVLTLCPLAARALGKARRADPTLMKVLWAWPWPASSLQASEGTIAGKGAPSSS